MRDVTRLMRELPEGRARELYKRAGYDFGKAIFAKMRKQDAKLFQDILGHLQSTKDGLRRRLSAFYCVVMRGTRPGESLFSRELHAAGEVEGLLQAIRERLAGTLQSDDSLAAMLEGFGIHTIHLPKLRAYAAQLKVNSANDS